VTKFIARIGMNLVTPKPAPKLEFLFNKLTSEPLISFVAVWAERQLTSLLSRKGCRHRGILLIVRCLWILTKKSDCVGYHENNLKWHKLYSFLKTETKFGIFSLFNQKFW